MIDKRQGRPAKGDRDARLGAALRANLARRKAQARAAGGRGTGDTGPDPVSGPLEPDADAPHFSQDQPGAQAPHDDSKKD